MRGYRCTGARRTRGDPGVARPGGPTPPTTRPTMAWSRADLVTGRLGLRASVARHTGHFAPKEGAVRDGPRACSDSGGRRFQLRRPLLRVLVYATGTLSGPAGCWPSARAGVSRPGRGLWSRRRDRGAADVTRIWSTGRVLLMEVEVGHDESCPRQGRDPIEGHRGSLHGERGRCQRLHGFT